MLSVNRISCVFFGRSFSVTKISQNKTSNRHRKTNKVRVRETEGLNSKIKSIFQKYGILKQNAPPPFHQDPNIPVSIDSIVESLRARNLETNQFRDQVLVLQCSVSGNSRFN